MIQAPPRAVRTTITATPRTRGAGRKRWRRRRRGTVPVGGPSSRRSVTAGSSSRVGRGSQVAASWGSARAGEGAELASTAARWSAATASASARIAFWCAGWGSTIAVLLDENRVVEHLGLDDAVLVEEHRDG